MAGSKARVRPVAWFPHLKAIPSRDESGNEECTAIEGGETEEADKEVRGEEETPVVKFSATSTGEDTDGTIVSGRLAAAMRATIIGARTSCVECVKTLDDAGGGTESGHGPPSGSQPCGFGLPFCAPD